MAGRPFGGAIPAFISIRRSQLSQSQGWIVRSQVRHHHKDVAVLRVQLIARLETRGQIGVGIEHAIIGHDVSAPRSNRFAANLRRVTFGLDDRHIEQTAK